MPWIEYNHENLFLINKLGNLEGLDNSYSLYLEAKS